MKQDDFLVEIHTEELPPKTLLKLAEVFCQQIKEQLQKAALTFTDITFFATPRRLAVLVQQLSETQPHQLIERKGPTLSAAFNEKGEPTPACVGFARSVGVTPAELTTTKTSQGEWMSFQQQVAGKSVMTLLPAIVEQALSALPISKRMRWGEGDTQFVRPVHAVILLYGDQVVEATILGCRTGRVTRGHRFMSPDWITIPHAASYASLLATEGNVLADFMARREMIRKQAMQCVKHHLGEAAQVLIVNDDLLNEVTGLVEWPVALCGQFEESFLTLPKEVLVSAMQEHQRYFPVIDAQSQLLPYFVTISNIQSHDMARVIHGNERVLRARLSDAAFFYATDQKEKLEQRLERLKTIIFQAKLGTLYDKAARLSQLAGFIAEKIGAPVSLTERAGWLAKTDLTTQMVGEFPELQGVMGYYYALHDHEVEAVAEAMKEQYLPRFAGDMLPKHAVGQAVAIADRLDTLVGIFGIHQLPTGDKDPYGLRRAALGVLRILIEKKLNLDLQEVLQFSFSTYENRLENKETSQQVFNFMQERLRAWYQDQAVSADVFAAVAALSITNPLDMHERIHAVQAFKKLDEAAALSIANKRVSNILAKYADQLEAKAIDAAFFEHEAERILAEQLNAKSQAVDKLYQHGQYTAILLQLAELRQPIDHFFDQVMVMAENKSQRENRILLLRQLRALFLRVADVALLQ